VHRVARVQISDGRPSAALVQGLGGTQISCSNEGTVTLDEEAVAAAGVLLLQPLQESLCRTQVATPEVSERLVVQRLGSARAATTVLATHEGALELPRELSERAILRGEGSQRTPSSHSDQVIREDPSAA